MVRPRFDFGSLAKASLAGCAMAASSLAFAAGAHADWTPVSGRVLNQMVPGSTVVIDAPMGFKLPIQHADDGSMTGEAGGLSFYLGSATDTGRWWVTSDKLCYKWARWFKSEARCMKIRRDGSRIEWEKDDGETGTAAMTLRKSPPPEQIADVAPPQSKGLASSTPRIAETTPGPAVAAAVKPAIPPKVPAKVAAVAAHVNNAPTRSPPPAAAPAKIATPTAPVRSPSLAPVREGVKAAQAAKVAAPGPRIAMVQTPPPYRVGGPPPPAYRVVSVAFDDVLNVRQGPSAEHPAIAALEPEAHGVRMIGPCQGEWCFVRHAEIVGWVNRYYLEEIPGR